MNCLQLGHKQGQTYCAGCAWSWFHTTEPLREHPYENWITTTRSKSAVVERLASGQRVCLSCKELRV